MSPLSVVAQGQLTPDGHPPRGPTAMGFGAPCITTIVCLGLCKSALWDMSESTDSELKPEQLNSEGLDP